LTRRFWSGIAMSAALALAEAWLGITLAFYSDWPVSFCISLLSALGYLAAIAATGPAFRYSSRSQPAKRMEN
jgi:zinc/manganese transport system permease protein